MKTTVILCTYNRCESLKFTLESLAASKLPAPISWEVLVIDNNSKDQTRSLIEKYCAQYPDRFRYLFEPRQGKSYALNTGIQAARGDILAFTDDDVTVEPDWLQNLTTALDDGRWGAAGGRILAPLDLSPPGWMALEGPNSMGGALALFDRGAEAAELTEAPFGANMAIRKTLFQKYGKFKTDMGPPPSDTRGEDTEFCLRLLAGGESLRYVPSAVVHHAVPASRLKEEYFLDWYFGHGRAMVKLKGYRPPVFGIPRYCFSIPKGVIGTVPTLLSWLFTLEPKRRFYLKTRVWYFVGQFGEMYRQSKCD